jgi:phytoene synthase
VRRVDEDRWLASRFASAEQRKRLVALYALNYEIARIAESVREPTLADLRYAWWRDALTARGAERGPPALRAFLDLWPERSAASDVLQIIEARRQSDLAAAPFADLDAMERYAEVTAGGLIAIAARCCGGLDEALAQAAGRAWGLAGLQRASAYWAARGRTLLPAPQEVLTARIEAAYAQARALSRMAPASAFPAYGYVALTPTYLRAPSPALLSRQVRLLSAAARGRF